MGLRLVWQPCPLCPALYTVSLRRLGTLPAASFRFHLSVDTLAVRLTLPTTKRVVDFHHQAIAHAGRTAIRGSKLFFRLLPLCCYAFAVMPLRYALPFFHGNSESL